MRRDLNSTEILQSRVGGKARIQLIENLLKEDRFLKRNVCKICLLKTLSICILHLKQNNFIKSNYSPLATRSDQGPGSLWEWKTAVPVCLDSESALNLLLAGNFIYDGGNEKRIIDCLENWVFVINVPKNADCLASEVCDWENMQPVWLSDLAYANTLKIWE